RIVLSVYPNQEQAVRDVERGTIDVLPSPPTDRIHELATRYANLLHSEPTATTLAFVMNTRVAPFDKLNVRRALNYAIDRNQIINYAGGPSVARPTCQILAPTLAGYRPLCPYTLDPSSSGSWTAPNLAKARVLIDRTRTRGTKIIVLTALDTIGDPRGKIG